MGTDSPPAVTTLDPAARRRLEHLVLQLAVRRHDARIPALPPAAEKLIREHADAFVAAVGPLTPEGAAALEEAWGEMARGYLDEELAAAEAGPDPAP